MTAPTCGSMQRMRAGYCVREHGHHGPCREENGRWYYNGSLLPLHRACAECELEAAALLVLAARRGRPLAGRRRRP